MTETAEPAALSPPASALLTFLLADIRGFTAYTDVHGDEAAAALSERFLALCREVVSSHGGEVFGSAGDQAVAAFSSARQALRAAIALQKRLAAEQEAHPDLPLMAGIGLDTGDAVRVGGDYRGGAINLAARLCSLAGKGEIFASEGVIRTAHKTDGIVFVDRGEVQLKGLDDPIRVVQIAPEGEVPDNLPPLQPILVTHPNNLPDEPTPFIGREGELRTVRELMDQPGVRLVTLTGVGGTGKTRLALQVASSLLSDYQDGVYFVNLAPLSDPALVPSAIAEVLGVKEEAGTELVSTLAGHLKDKRLLLVLDNFEHLLDASSVLSSLLDSCRQLHVLVTSRVPLHLSREHEHTVPPLSVPDPDHLPDLEHLSQYEAVALFIERARAAQDTFTVTNENAPAVAEICARLDGLPLAIELAAARIKLFPPQALLQRLSSRLKLLTGGARDRPTRQQTLRNTLDWSYSLLSPEEQELFARLSVFVGGCSLEAAEVVCNPEGEMDLLDALSGLVDKSLVQQRGAADEPRFVMLETVKEYAGGQLLERGEEEKLRAAHAAYFTKLAEEAEPELRGPEQAAWLARLEREHENLRAALSWSEQSKSALGLRLGGALWRFWSGRGYWSEGRRWLETMLAVNSGLEQRGAPRAKVLHGAGVLSYWQDDYRRAHVLLEESLQLWRDLVDVQGIADSLTALGNVVTLENDIGQATEFYEEGLQLRREMRDERGTALSLSILASVAMRKGDYRRAKELEEDSLQLRRKLGDTGGIAASLCSLGTLASWQDDYDKAGELLGESLQLNRELGDKQGIGWCLVQLGTVAWRQGDYDKAEQLYDDALCLQRELGDKASTGMGLFALGFAALRKGDWERAGELEEESLRLMHELGLKFGIAHPVTGLAAVAGFRQEHDRAVRLLSAADGIWASVEAAPDACFRPALDEMSKAARAALGAEAYETARNEGQGMTVEQAVEYALHDRPESAP